jgi:hypothetical protein
MAERSATLWEGTAWQAAILEALAHIARAEGDSPRSRELLRGATNLFEAAGHPLDAARCSHAADDTALRLPPQRADDNADAHVS